MRRRAALGLGIPVAFLALAAGSAVLVADHHARVLVRHTPEERAAHLQENPGSRLEESLIRHRLEGAERITLRAEDGVRLGAVYVPSRNRASVILVHGYKEPGSEMVPVAAFLQRRGYGSILLQLRAHGASGGERITFGREEILDLQAAHRHLRERPDVNPERIGGFGNSMGGRS